MSKKLQILNSPFAPSLSEEEVIKLILSQLGKFVVIGEAEPESGPVFWFDTSMSGVSSGADVLLVLGDEDDVSDVTAVIDGMEYPILNAGEPLVADDGESYVIEIS